MILFVRILLGLDVIIALIAVYFFLAGLADGSVSSFNAGVWLAMLAALAIIIGGGGALSVRKHHIGAAILLSILAVPGLLYALFVILVVMSGTKWN